MNIKIWVKLTPKHKSYNSHIYLFYLFFVSDDLQYTFVHESLVFFILSVFAKLVKLTPKHKSCTQFSAQQECDALLWQLQKGRFSVNKD